MKYEDGHAGSDFYLRVRQSWHVLRDLVGAVMRGRSVGYAWEQADGTVKSVLFVRDEALLARMRYTFNDHTEHAHEVYATRRRP